MSVVVRSRNEADRLRLVLASLAAQTQPAEIVIVDDGSVDHTGLVLAHATNALNLTIVRHATPLGRSAASNAGAQAASGDLLVFLDGDTLASPDMVAAHISAQGAGRIGRGETWHLRCTRHLLDPEAGTPQPGHVIAAAELEEMKVTRHQIGQAFEAILRRAQPGIYPGIAPRRLHALEMTALREHPDCEVLWAAASGSNLSVARAAFLGAGGFDCALDINEHRELALRLCRQGLQMVPVEGARSFHLTHRSAWRDPLRATEWQDIIYRAHPLAAVKLLPVFWASLSDHGPEHRVAIRSLPELAAAAAAAA